MVRALVGCGTASFFTLFLTACSNPARETSKMILAASNATTPIPPSFVGHPLAYAAAIFSQLLVFSFGMAILMFMVASLDLRRDRCSLMIDGSCRWNSPINVYRVSIILFMASICLGTGSNLLLYLSWNEVSSTNIAILTTVEKVCKSLVCVPFLASVYLLFKNDEVVVSQLIRAGCPEPLWPEGHEIRQHWKTVALVLAIAVGVTLGKWTRL